MAIKYQIYYQEEVVRKHLPKLTSSTRSMIKRAIEERLMVDPIGFGKPLRYSMKGHRRLRVSNYRIVYRIDNITNIVIVIAILHRKDAYTHVSR